MSIRAGCSSVWWLELFTAGCIHRLIRIITLMRPLWKPRHRAQGSITTSCAVRFYYSGNEMRVGGNQTCREFLRCSERRLLWALELYQIDSFCLCCSSVPVCTFPFNQSKSSLNSPNYDMITKRSLKVDFETVTSLISTETRAWILNCGCQSVKVSTPLYFIGKFIFCLQHKHYSLWISTVMWLWR